jgi:hypothetical protein
MVNNKKKHNFYVQIVGFNFKKMIDYSYYLH